MAQVTPKTFVQSPPRVARIGGIRSVIGEFTRNDRLGMGSTVEFIGHGNDFPVEAPGLCYGYIPEDSSGAPTAKEGSAIDVFDGISPNFALYAGVECFIHKESDFDARAIELLTQGEDRGVEEWLSLWAAGLSGTTATTLVEAVALAEQYADANYLGRPILLMSRGDAVRARAAKAILGEGDSLITANGTPVIATASADGLDGVAIMGNIEVHASQMGVFQADEPILNTRFAIAERVYGIAVDEAFGYTVTIGEE